MEDPTKSPAAELMTQTFDALHSLNDHINEYVRAYIDTYETLSESIMLRSQFQRFDMIRPGTEQEIRTETDGFFERIASNAADFRNVFNEIHALFDEVRRERTPTTNHENVLENASNRVVALREQIDNLRKSLENIRQDIREREAHYTMAAYTHQLKRIYPIWIQNWFPVDENFQTKPLNWYWIANHYLLSILKTQIAIVVPRVNALIHRQYEINNNLLDWEGDIHQLKEDCQQLDQRVNTLNARVREIIELSQSEESTEEDLRNAVIELIDVNQSQFQNIYDEQQQLIDVFNE